MGLRRLSVAISIGLMAIVTMPALANAEEGEEEPAIPVVSDANVTRKAFGGAQPTNGWYIYTSSSTAKATFVNGPANPPFMVGSLEISTASATDKVSVLNFDHIGKPLSSINTLAYSTYRTTGIDQQIAHFNVQIDANGPNETGGLTTLVFEPANNPLQGPVNSNGWFPWYPFWGGDAILSSTSSIPGATDIGTLATWGQIVAANPNATIAGGIGITQGTGTAGLVTAIDKIAINESVYDFEYVEVQQPTRATSKEQCMDNGYKDFGDTYKNQGACVSDVVKNENARKE